MLEVAILRNIVGFAAQLHADFVIRKNHSLNLRIMRIIAMSQLGAAFATLTSRNQILKDTRAVAMNQ